MFLINVKPFLLLGDASAPSRRAARAGIVALLCAFSAACTSGGQEAGPIKGAASAVGWATTVPESKPFVVARRTTEDLKFVPIGRGGVERPVVQRNAAAVRDLETQLDQNRTQSETFARRQLPTGAYNQPLPSVAAPPARPAGRSAANERPAPGAPESFPVNPNRLRQIRENSRQVTE